jgi:hypothetical protein
MENQDQENKAKSTEATPKPTDEVQLTIETVTPDTHQSVPETTVDSEKVEDKVEGANDNKEVDEVKELSNDKDATDTDEEVVEEDKKENEDDDAEGDEKELTEDEQKGDDDGEGDIRDSIETVAP